MTKTLPIAALLLFTLACNSDSTVATTDTTAATPAVTEVAATVAHTFAVKPTYSGAFEIGDYKQADIVVELWKQYDDNTLDKGKDYFADTVTMWMADGWQYHGTRDSLLKLTKKSRSEYGTVKSVLVAIIPLKSTDMNSNWVSIYGNEYLTNKKNKVDSSALQEAWRFNKDGKIDVMHQYRRKL